MEVTIEELRNELTQAYYRLHNMNYILENRNKTPELDDEELQKIVGDNSVSQNMDNYFSEQVFFKEICFQFNDDPVISELCPKLISLHRNFYKMVFLNIIEDTINDYDKQIKRYIKKKYGKH